MILEIHAESIAKPEGSDERPEGGRPVQLGHTHGFVPNGRQTQPSIQHRSRIRCIAVYRLARELNAELPMYCFSMTLIEMGFNEARFDGGEPH